MSEENVKTTEQTAAPEEKKKSAKPRKKGAKAAKQLGHANVYIQATYNNTIVSVADLNGNVVAWSTAGHCGFKGPKKATPYAASVVVKNVLEKVNDYGVKDVSLFVTGIGQGREGAIRAFNTNNLNVISIKDVTPMPHNGCRKPRARRL
ncbi:MAG: 30S ribosomal protein S11 [Patescibacteria group bacterium]|jgi:small subunit ribosomal protein S11|nr:30S ribosomal protein S11 [Patescibacteria group bacterium]